MLINFKDLKWLKNGTLFKMYKIKINLLNPSSLDKTPRFMTFFKANLISKAYYRSLNGILNFSRAKYINKF